MRVSLAFAGALAAAVCLTSQASAALFSRPGGFFYDDVLDITWMADANYGKTFGLSADGLVTQAGAEFLAGGYVYFNSATGILHSDWRLPTLGPDVDDYHPNQPGSGGQLPNGQGATGTGWGTPDDSGIYSELGWMYYANLGGRAACEAVGAEPCVYNPNCGLPDYGSGPDRGPFANLQLDFYWTNVRAEYPDDDYNAFWAFTFDDGNQSPRAAQQGREPLSYVWLVHDGDIAAAAVPEPSTWALLLGGFGLMGAALRRRARVSSSGSPAAAVPAAG